MTRDKIYFGFGLLIGIATAALFLYYFAPRYNTVKSGDTLLKQDRWSGQTWRFVDEYWKPITDTNRDWEKIDKALMKALSISTDVSSRNTTLDLLRSKYAILKDLTDDELLERIKSVYSKKILVDLYLQNFLNLQKARQGDQ
jgi:hypothetical protein